MLKAIFVTAEVIKGQDKKTLVVNGELQEGEIQVGMFLKIAFNASFGMTVPISKIVNKSGNQMTLILDCKDEEGANFVESMNFEHEWVEIQDEE
ncbi:MAG TPA: hypothetical protein PKY59_00220 [Pyrinomonadaceae bacterium]|nr:hypothetical protein [Pyrinomonadaceae bacterium]